MNSTAIKKHPGRIFTLAGAGIIAAVFGTIAIVSVTSGDSKAPAKLPVADESQVDPRPIGAFQFWNPQVGFDVYPWDNRSDE